MVRLSVLLAVFQSELPRAESLLLPPAHHLPQPLWETTMKPSRTTSPLITLWLPVNDGTVGFKLLSTHDCAKKIWELQGVNKNELKDYHTSSVACYICTEDF